MGANLREEKVGQDKECGDQRRAKARRGVSKSTEEPKEMNCTLNWVLRG